MSQRLRWPRQNLIEGKGFSVETLGRTGLRYCENGRTMHIDSEVLLARGIMLYRSSVKRWDPPNNEEPVDDKTRDRIIENIRQVFASKGDEGRRELTFERPAASSAQLRVQRPICGRHRFPIRLKARDRMVLVFRHLAQHRSKNGVVTSG